jgi:hypothetical protein
LKKVAESIASKDSLASSVALNEAESADVKGGVPWWVVPLIVTALRLIVAVPAYWIASVLLLMLGDCAKILDLFNNLAGYRTSLRLNQRNA